SSSRSSPLTQPHRSVFCPFCTEFKCRGTKRNLGLRSHAQPRYFAGAPLPGLVARLTLVSDGRSRLQHSIYRKPLSHHQWLPASVGAKTRGREQQRGPAIFFKRRHSRVFLKRQCQTPIQTQRLTSTA